jgi:hypothetical protein
LNGRKTRRHITLAPMKWPVIKDEAAMIGHNRVHVWPNAAYMLGGMPETDFERNETLDTITFSVRDLFTPDELQTLGTRLPTTKEVFDPKRLERLGIDRCPPTTALAILAEHDATLPSGRFEYIAMEPIPDRDGYPYVFYVGRRGGGSLCLDRGWAGPESAWDLDDRIVFSLRK